MDLSVELPAVTPADLANPGDCESTQSVAARVAAARDAQIERGKSTNAALPDAALSKHANPDAEGSALLSRASEALNLSARAYMRILRVARTLADLDGATAVKRRHIAEAVSFRRRQDGVQTPLAHPPQKRSVSSAF